MRNKVVVITGSRGFIGQILTQYLLDRGYGVIGVDIQNENAIVKTPNHIEYPECFTGLDFIHRLFETHRAGDLFGIVHLAANSLLGNSVKNPLPYFENNVSRSIEFVRQLIEHDIKVPFIFASSAAVYGNSSKQYCSEDDVLKPINPYGRTKLQFEEFLNEIAEPYQFNATSFRFFNVIGAYQNSKGEWFSQADDQPHVITSMLRAYKNNEVFKINGNTYPTPDGTSVRDYIDVQDICEAILIELEGYPEYPKDSFCNLPINLGTGIGVSLAELVAIVQELLPETLQVSFGEKRPGDPARLVSDSLLMKLLSRTPTISLHESIENTLIAKGIL